MFEVQEPRLFGVPPGADFPMALAQGLRTRLAGEPPEAMARVDVYLNSARMRRAVTAAFLALGASFLPRLRLITELGDDPTLAIAPPLSPLRRRLELSRLITALLDRTPDLAPRSAIYDLADSLAALLDEMHGEAVPPEAIASLDVSDHSAHWQRTQDFLGIMAPYVMAADAPDAEARQRLAVRMLIGRWAEAPPCHPVIVAGSTGSRGTTALFMQAVARLPRGGLVVPGFDFQMPAAVWEDLSDAMTAEDHPQFRYRRLLTTLGIGCGDVRPWSDEPERKQALNRLVSLSLRPAPVTDQWLSEGADLPDLDATTHDLTLVEAPAPRTEALVIALILRKAAEDGVEAALISPDRVLTRQVTAALDRWGIRPDDSAGRPLDLSAPGRFLRHVAALFGRKLTAEALLTILKHPLTATGAGAARGDHLRLTRDLELRLRRKGPVFPTPDSLRSWARDQADAAVWPWADWLATVLAGTDAAAAQPLADHVARHLAVAEALAGGPGSGTTGELWLREAGAAARSAMDDLAREAPHGGVMGAFDYADLFAAVLARGEVREAVQGHPLIRILGPREARECRAPRVILGGLNDGSWPQLPAPDPWLNRQMRMKAGLLLPERQIGLSAHDYQQAMAAQEVYLTRSLRDAEAETVPSRWINRLTNLMRGLPDRNGPLALTGMKARGQAWLDLAQAIDRPEAVEPPAPRPAPRPPVDQRPRELPVTAISKLIRDPFAIYARYILRLRPLDPLRPVADAALRGSTLHVVLERFMQDRSEGETQETARSRLLAVTDTVLSEDVPWPAARALWRARIDRAADVFLAREARSDGTPQLMEKRGSIALGALGFTLTAKPDRIDALPDGRLHILDYKTGSPPTRKMQANFDKQLLLEAAMAERGAFATLGPREVARISYVGLSASAAVIETEITPEITAEVWHDLHRLIERYQARDQGYAARRAVFETRRIGEYDHLARFGEWEMTDASRPEDVE